MIWEEMVGDLAAHGAEEASDIELLDGTVVVVSHVDSETRVRAGLFEAGLGGETGDAKVCCATDSGRGRGHDGGQRGGRVRCIGREGG